MFEFHFVYLCVVVIALAQWAYSRWTLSRGLHYEFRKFRQQRSMDFFFSHFAKQYLTLMAWTLFHVVFIYYSAVKLLGDLGLLSLESASFTAIAVFFLAKDRAYYQTALYVLSKKEG